MRFCDKKYIFQNIATKEQDLFSYFHNLPKKLLFF